MSKWTGDCLSGPGADDPASESRFMWWMDLEDKFLGHFMNGHRLFAPLQPETKRPWRLQSDEDWHTLRWLWWLSDEFWKWATQLQATPPDYLEEELPDSTSARDFFLELEDLTYPETVATSFDGNPIIEEKHISDFLRESLFRRLAFQNAKNACVEAERATNLLKRLVTVRGHITGRYLNRVGLCYVRGMSTEGVVMCRSVMENVLSDLLDDNTVLRHVGRGDDIGRRRPKLDDYISYAYDEEVLDSETYSAARFIQYSGNNAVHDAPDMARLDDVLDKLILVLRRIEE